ncbi:MAG: DUF4124 domain-containing protein [Desulfobacteraceae bacterium]|jgi:hypothetical protein
MKTITLSGRKARIKMVGSTILWSSALLMTAITARADIYSWQDEQGVIHYSNYNVPYRANLYLKEPVRVSPAPETQVDRSPSRSELYIEAIRQQAKAEARIEEANRKLDRALDKVDELTRKVSQSQAQADAAADAARQAAADAERQAASVNHYPNDVKERVIVHSTIYYPYGYKKHSPHSRRPNYLVPNKRGQAYDNIGGRSGLHKRKHSRNHRIHDRHRIHRSRPVPVLPARSRIPKAYGIR